MGGELEAYIRHRVGGCISGLDGPEVSTGRGIIVSDAITTGAVPNDQIASAAVPENSRAGVIARVVSFNPAAAAATAIDTRSRCAPAITTGPAIDHDRVSEHQNAALAIFFGGTVPDHGANIGENAAGGGAGRVTV